MTTARIEKFDHEFSVTLDDDKYRLTLYRDGVYAGCGVWEDGGIHNSDAVLVGGDPEDTEEVYEALEEALAEALEDKEEVYEAR